jgi:hypothetical protein
MKNVLLITLIIFSGVSWAGVTTQHCETMAPLTICVYDGKTAIITASDNEEYVNGHVSMQTAHSFFTAKDKEKLLKRCESFTHFMDSMVGRKRLDESSEPGWKMEKNFKSQCDDAADWLKTHGYRCNTDGVCVPGVEALGPKQEFVKLNQ